MGESELADCRDKIVFPEVTRPPRPALDPSAVLTDLDDQGRRAVMLVASLQVVASKCCHAAAMPAGGPEPAAGREDPDRTQVYPALLRRTRVADRPAKPDRRRPGGLSACDSLRVAHRGDQERTDTWNTSGMCRLFFSGPIIHGMLDEEQFFHVQ